MKNIRNFYLKIFIILVGKFSVYLNRHVFEMISAKSEQALRCPSIYSRVYKVKAYAVENSHYLIRGQHQSRLASIFKFSYPDSHNVWFVEESETINFIGCDDTQQSFYINL